MAYFAIKIHLCAVSITIYVDRFFPYSYWLDNLDIERNFESDHEETHTQLRNFMKKYDVLKEDSWARGASLELDWFRGFNVQDLKNYVPEMRPPYSPRPPWKKEDEDNPDREESSVSIESGQDKNDSDNVVVVERKDAESLERMSNPKSSILKKKPKLNPIFRLGLKRKKVNPEIIERTNALLETQSRRFLKS
jgi:hypothetical protein